MIPIIARQLSSITLFCLLLLVSNVGTFALASATNVGFEGSSYDGDGNPDEGEANCASSLVGSAEEIRHLNWLYDRVLRMLQALSVDPEARFFRLEGGEPISFDRTLIKNLANTCEARYGIELKFETIVGSQLNGDQRFEALICEVIHEHYSQLKANLVGGPHFLP